MAKISEKFERLKNFLFTLNSVAVAYSGGVDSTFLLKTAHDVLGDKVIALTATSEFVPRRELDEAIKFCNEEKIRQVIFTADVLAIDGISDNPVDRCYLCKRELFKNFLRLAEENGAACVVEGSNVDDEGDYRPGMKALAELEIKSPLRVARLYKSEIRELSRRMNLPTADKPSFACLASRFVYGERLTEEKLSMVERAEELLRIREFNQFRVRIHGKLARIEILPEDFEKIMQSELRAEIVEKFTAYGFEYVSLDLQGYRAGSMNPPVENSIASKYN